MCHRTLHVILILVLSVNVILTVLTQTHFNSLDFSIASLKIVSHCLRDYLLQVRMSV